MYTIKNVKSFQGREGHGYSCDLYRDGKKVATVTDTANGGSVDFYWLDTGKAPRVPITCHNYRDELHTYNGTPEEKQFVEHADGQTYVSPITNKTERKDSDIFMSELVDAFENKKRLKRLCKTKTVFALKSQKGEYYTFNRAYNPQLADMIRAKYGEDLAEIVNERVGG
jgi:hypothetical protein